jgi:hypothetical protein
VGFIKLSNESSSARALIKTLFDKIPPFPLLTRGKGEGPNPVKSALGEILRSTKKPWQPDKMEEALHEQGHERAIGIGDQQDFNPK